MAELFKIAVTGKTLVDDIDDRILPDGMTLSIVLLRLQKKKLAGMTKLKKPGLTEAFLKAKTAGDRLRSFGALLAASPDAAEKIVDGLVKTKTGLDGWIQRRYLADACGKPKPDSLAVVNMTVEQLRADSPIPDDIHGDRLHAFVCAVVGLKGLRPEKNAMLDRFGGMEGITRRNIDVMHEVVFGSKIVERKGKGPKEKIDVEFVSPAPYVAHLAKGDKYDTTGWPILG